MNWSAATPLLSWEGVPARTAKREPDRAKPQEKSEQAGVVPLPLLAVEGTTPPSLTLGRPS